MSTPSNPQEHPTPEPKPEWLNEFEELANQQLEDGSSCEQVHPIIAQWYENLLQSAPPDSRDSVLQAMSCLTTEIMADIPDDVFTIMLKHVDEDELAGWIEYVLMVGRAFEISLRKGDLDDL